MLPAVFSPPEILTRDAAPEGRDVMAAAESGKF